MNEVQLITKEQLIDEIKAIANRGWINGQRQGNHGNIGNTIEDLLGIAENNLPIPNAAEWEIKTQRVKSNSLITLCHTEPSPRAARIVPSILLPKYGWGHKEAGKKYPIEEMSFRQTISCNSATDRGFAIRVNEDVQRIEINFSSNLVSKKHALWHVSVENRIGLTELNPIPYWGFDDLFHTMGKKLLNTFLIEAETRRNDGKEEFRCKTLKILRSFTKQRMLDAIKQGHVLVDFDARTGHNHGTKFRIRPASLAEFYSDVTVINLF